MVVWGIVAVSALDLAFDTLAQGSDGSQSLSGLKQSAEPSSSPMSALWGERPLSGVVFGVTIGRAR